MDRAEKLSFEFEKRGQQIKDRLVGLYPMSANKGNITNLILREMNLMLEKHNATYADWYNALDTHRFTVNRGSDFPPTASDLLKIILDGREETKEVSVNTDTIMKEFAYLVKTRGWLEAIMEFKQDPDTVEWIENTDTSYEYACFPEGYRQYLTIFHSGDIIGATEYYYNNSKAKNKLALRKELDQARIIGNVKLKSFYNYFSDKNCRKGTKKDILTQTKYETDGSKQAKTNIAKTKQEIGL